MAGRDKSKDGFRNRIELGILTSCKPLWGAVQRNERSRSFANKFLINNAAQKIPPRPYPFSAKTPYTSWDSLIDRNYAGLHLPPLNFKPLTDEPHLKITLSPVGDFESRLPGDEALTDLFTRRGAGTQSLKSTVLFPHFVQWFADGFLRTDRTNNRKVTSNHHIDLCGVYGLRPEHTMLLRSSKEPGRLKSQMINGEEYPEYVNHESRQPKLEFQGLPHLQRSPGGKALSGWDLDDERKRTLFAMGAEIERSNVQPGYAMFNILCLREHNRLVGLLERSYNGWDSDRLFETARNIATVEIMKIVMEEYINHITPYHFKFITDAGRYTKSRWYRQNWMTVEFNLAYRWHSMLPDRLNHRGVAMELSETRYNNPMITNHGLGSIFQDASTQKAMDLGLHNTANVLVPAELAGVRLGRDNKLRRYNDYRELLKYPRATSYEQISSKPEVIRSLEKHYGKDVDNLELYVGMHAEDLRKNSALPPMIGRLVGIDAFSQALTNPLLAENVFNKETFTPVGWEEIMSLSTLSQLVHRNLPEGQEFTVSFRNADWKPAGHLRG